MVECLETAENLMRKAAPVGLYAYLPPWPKMGTNPANTSHGRPFTGGWNATIGAALFIYSA